MKCSFIRLLIACTLFVAVVGGPRAARAQRSAVADALFQEARKLMDEGRYDDACAKFQESDRLEPAVGTKFNLANCEQQRGRLATAWVGFRRVVDLLPADDERRPIAQERVDVLAPRVPRLKILREQGAPRNTNVLLDGSPLTSAGFGASLPLDPGEHQLLVSSPGHEPRRVTVRVVEGERNTLGVAPGPLTTEQPPTEQPPAQEATPSSQSQPAAGPTSYQPQPLSATDDKPSSSKRTMGFAIGGVGVAGLLTGAIAGGLALSKKSTRDENCNLSTRVCNQAGLDAHDSARTLSVVSNVGWVVGALGLGTGAYFIFTTSDSEAETAVRAGPGNVSVVRAW